MKNIFLHERGRQAEFIVTLRRANCSAAFKAADRQLEGESA